MPSLRNVVLSVVLGCAVSAAATSARAQTAENDKRWADLQPAMFPDQKIGDGSALMTLEAPDKAADAALVPISITLVSGPNRARIRHITLVVDANPSPLAGNFTLGAESGIVHISTRIRVEDFTYIHAVAELDDGTMLAARRFIRAAGGCSAPAAAEVHDGRMIGSIRVRAMPPQETAATSQDSPDLREVKILINHPNFSGMQMNQATQLYVPAFFINHMEVLQGDRPLLSVDSGISIAENPEYRFDFRADAAPMHVKVEDSESKTYTKDYTLPPA